LGEPVRTDPRRNREKESVTTKKKKESTSVQKEHPATTSLKEFGTRYRKRCLEDWEVDVLGTSGRGTLWETGQNRTILFTRKGGRGRKLAKKKRERIPYWSTKNRRKTHSQQEGREGTIRITSFLKGEGKKDQSY